MGLQQDRLAARGAADSQQGQEDFVHLHGVLTAATSPALNQRGSGQCHTYPWWGGLVLAAASTRRCLPTRFVPANLPKTWHRSRSTSGPSLLPQREEKHKSCTVAVL